MRQSHYRLYDRTEVTLPSLWPMIGGCCLLDRLHYYV